MKKSISSADEALFQYVKRASGRENLCFWAVDMSLSSVLQTEGRWVLIHRQRRSETLPSDMLFSTCKKHMRRLLISAWSSLSHRRRVLPRAEAGWLCWTNTDKCITLTGFAASPSFFDCSPDHSQWNHGNLIISLKVFLVEFTSSLQPELHV